MGYLKISLFVKCLVLFTAFSLFADEPVRFDLSAENQTVTAGEPFWMAAHFQVEDSWHAYWKNPGDAGMAPQITWNLPEGYTVDTLEWPVPEKFTTGGMTGYGYAHEAVLLAKITPPAELKSNDSVEIGADVKWVVCNSETCLPGSSEQSIKIAVGNSSKLNPEQAALFKSARGKIPLKSESNTAIIQTDGVDAAALKDAFFAPESLIALNDVTFELGDDRKVKINFKDEEVKDGVKGVFVVNGKGYELNVLPVAPPLADDTLNSTLMASLFALIGGLILNLMPCVLPVVSLKILSFIKLAGSNRLAVLKQGLAYAFGITASFWALALILIILKAYGHSAGWGFQMQSPLFIAIFASLMLLLALSLFGVFEVGLNVSSWAGEQSSKQKGLSGSFLSGVLATAVATPCTGPFLGSAMGYAFTRPPYETLIIFTALGIGMASPYLILSAFPSLSRFVPKPGAWMESLKQFMGFMMLLAVLWLAWVFAGQTDADSLVILMGGFLILSLGAWIYGRWGSFQYAPKVRIASSLIALALAFSSFIVFNFAVNKNHESITTNSDWEPFSLERLSQLRKEGTPVFVDFTAKWCLICQTNHLVLSGDEVKGKLDEKGVVKMKADWTLNDPIITEQLKKFGRSGVPLYLYYGKESEPKILPQVLTSDIILKTIE